jgi:hypothetical protein
LYTQHLIFYATYELAQKSRLLHNTKLKGLPMTNALAYWACF